MKAILIYILETLACGAVLHLLYHTTIESRVRFVGCRAYLLMASALSAVIPALDIRLWRDQIIYIEATTINTTAVTTTSEQLTNDVWVIVFIAIYAIGVAAIAQSVIRQIVKIARLGQATVEEGQRIVRTNKIDTPFSFLRTIYLPTLLAEEQTEIVMQHERAHISHHHSIERFAMEVMKAAMWFNPFVWLFSRLLTEAHEFEADREVIDSGFDNRLYATSIFTQAFGFSPDIANGLQSSLTKKRFKMMTKSTPSTRSLLRLAAALPVVATLAILFSVRAQATVYLPVEKQSPESATDFTEVRTYSAEPVLSAADSTKLREYRAEPAVPFMLVEDKTTKEEEAIPFLLVDDKDKKDDEAIPFLLVDDKDKKDDEAIPFLLVDDEKKKELQYKDIAFVRADKMPTFDGRGNINDFINWCSTQLNYNNGTAGMRVVMHFVVETDGTIKEVNALQGDAKSCAEVERVIRLSSGRWSAGVQRGEKVRVAYTIPIAFSK